MKKLLVCILVMSVLFTRGQAPTGATLNPLCRAQKITSTDTGRLAAMLCGIGVDGFKSISFAQVPVAGQNTTTVIFDTTIWKTNVQATAYAHILGGQAGQTYLYKITGTTSMGSILTAYDSLIVTAPAPPCPVCPAIPAPRYAVQIVTTEIFTNGVWSSKKAILYNDGTTQ